MSEPIVRATRYEVSLLPEDDINYRHYAVIVEYMDGRRWAVHDRFRCLGADGTWDEGLEPYGRGDEWLAAHRFDLDTALRLAKEAAPHVRVNRWTAAEALAERLKEAS